MRKLFALMLLTCFSTANATSVVIDFEEVAYVSVNDPVLTLDSQNYRFTSIMATAEYNDEPIVGSRSLAYCPSCTLTMEHVEGRRFSLTSFDLGDYGSWPAGGMLITGYRAGGGTISQTLEPTGSLSSFAMSGDWVGLTRIDIGPSSPDGFGIVIDNIALTAVPVPPAIWLMGSALGALALRRKRAAA